MSENFDDLHYSLRYVVRLKTQYELTSQENKHLLMAKFVNYEYEQGNNQAISLTQRFLPQNRNQRNGSHRQQI